MTRETIRRRRGNSTVGSSGTTTSVQQSTDGVSASPGAGASTRRNTNATSTSPSSPRMEPTQPKTIEKVLEEEEESFGNFLKLSAILTFIFFYMIRTTQLPPARRVFAVIVDAGSTGTRAQIFQFIHNATSDQLILQETKLHTIKKSIAALGTGVGGTGSQFFKPLLENAKKGVPGIRRRRRTPIILGATAGLRLLGVESAERALQSARTAFNATEFLFNDDHISILNAIDEAKHGWTTVNYLLNRVGPGATGSLVATLELGGASVQIVHPITDGSSERIKSTSVDVLGGEYELAAISHLGLGLFSFTQKLYAMFEIEDVLVEDNPCFRKGKTFKNKMLKLGVEGSEEVKHVTIIGDGEFERCVASAEIVIANTLDEGQSINPLPEDSTAYAFAFFYDRTVGYGMSRQPSKEEFLQKGKELCEDAEINTPGDMSRSKANADEACAEFSYVFALMKLLTEDFSKKRNVNILFEQYIEGHMLGWALGAALQAVEPTMDHQISLDKEPLTV